MTQSTTMTETTKTCCGPECCGSEKPARTESAARAPEQLVEAVRSRYAEIAATGGSCCGPSTCGALSKDEQHAMARSIGYSEAELEQLPEGANLGLGCGAPVPALALQAGETVLDLGSGAGLDVFIAAELVGSSGKAIGVDMTPEMVERARANAERLGVGHAEFRQGRLEALPVESASVDAVTSNCVINLVPDKRQVFQEIARVLKPGGRVVISDIMLAGALPPAIGDDLLAYTGCVAGAVRRERYFADLGAAGLSDVEVLRDVDYLASVLQAVPAEAEELLGRVGVRVEDVAGLVRSVTFRARRAIA